LNSEGRLFGWGRNSMGQLGDPSLSNKCCPVEISSTSSILNNLKILSVAPGFAHTLAITVDGTLVGWGYNQV
jgi:alpha-tubulin suppressor-like RCC1 family protein